MELILEDETLRFEIINVNISQTNIENIFKENKRTLSYTLDKAISDEKNRLHKIATGHKDLYSNFLDMKLGEFLYKLKQEGNEDYILYLNKYGDKKFCIYSIDQFERDKGIYCYIIEDEIVYIGRSKKTFKQRFKDYGKITAYNCLINGQATNCHINSKINNLNNVYVGIYNMTNKTDEEINLMEKKILKQKSFRWNIQKR